MLSLDSRVTGQRRSNGKLCQDLTSLPVNQPASPHNCSIACNMQHNTWHASVNAPGLYYSFVGHLLSVQFVEAALKLAGIQYTFSCATFAQDVQQINLVDLFRSGIGFFPGGSKLLLITLDLTRALGWISQVTISLEKSVYYSVRCTGLSVVMQGVINLLDVSYLSFFRHV